jgi:hypothetical protein
LSRGSEASTTGAGGRDAEGSTVAFDERSDTRSRGAIALTNEAATTRRTAKRMSRRQGTT